MRLPKKQWLVIQLAALLVITGGVFLIRPYLARAVNVSPSTMGGLGITGMPYLITNCQELQDINLDLDAEYALANNIDCTDTMNWNAGGGFNPIGINGVPFGGRLDGKNHTIDGLYIDRTGASDSAGLAGLFAAANPSGRLLNFTVTNATIIGNGHSGNNDAATGGIIGSMDGGLIDRVSFSGNISVPECNASMRIGGIAGNAQTTSGWTNFQNIKSQGAITVTGTDCGSYNTTAGGLIGYSTYGLFNTYSTMSITLGGDTTSECTYNCRYVGGLIGTNGSSGTKSIQASYYAGPITIAAGVTPHQIYAVGGLFGYAESGMSISNSFAVPQITTPATCLDIDCGVGIRKTSAIGGNDGGLSASGNGNWTGVYFDQTVAGTTHCADGLDDTNYRCNAVNTDGLDPDYFKGLAANPPILVGFDVTNPVWQLTTGYPELLDGTVPYAGAPTNVLATIDSATSISLTWTASTPDASGYEVLCRKANDPWRQCNNYSSNTYTTIFGLDPSTQYEFKIAPTGAPTYVGTLSDSVFATTATPGFVLINDCQQLQNINNDLSKNYELAHDIDCSDTITWNGGLGFDPIGLFSPTSNTFDMFTGILKGNNYTIRNLYIDQTTVPEGAFGSGLFSGAEGALIQDLKIDQPTLVGGVVIGTVYGFGQSTLSNVHVTNATITGEFAGAGGLVGYGWNNNNHLVAINNNSFEGTIAYTGATTAGYLGGLYAFIAGGTSGGYTLSNNYANATISSATGSSITGGFIGAVDASGPGIVSINRSYAAGSTTVGGAYQASANPQIPDLGSWASGGLVGATFAADANTLTLANSFAHITTSISGSQALVGSIIGGQLGSSTPGGVSPTDLSSVYADTDQAGTSQCIGSLTSNCNSISGQPNYFKNNSTNPPLNTWDFSNIWMTTSEFPVFGTAVTTGITTIPPERLNPPTNGGGSTNGEGPAVTSTADGGSVAKATSGAFSKTADTPSDEVGVLGAVKRFVRNLPAIVVVGFPYALFGLLLVAALVLLVELIRELRRIQALQILIHKQQLLAEERDAFWHLAANYLRAPVTLIVGGAEALREANMVDVTAGIATLAASLQKKVADIMAKIEGSTSLQAISQVQPRKATQIARRAVFIIPVASVAALTLLANYAATSFRNMSPGFIGYATQLIGFVIATILFYRVLSLLTNGKSKRKAAEELLDRQTNELANARHELIAETANSLNPDLTNLEGMLHALPAAMAASATGAVSTLNEGTARLREIVNSFSMLIKVQEGTGSVTAAPEASTVDLAGILAKTRAKLTPQIAAKNVRVEAPAVPLAVHAEADLANQVLSSIIANAVDYSPANGTVKVEAKRLQDAIQVRISDQGQGIDKKQLDHLFQPFVRTDGKSAMDMSHGGFGINLYLDKLIMEQLGGSITAASTPGKGTSFTMTWPV